MNGTAQILKFSTQSLQTNLEISYILVDISMILSTETKTILLITQKNTETLDYAPNLLATIRPTMPTKTSYKINTKSMTCSSNESS